SNSSKVSVQARAWTDAVRVRTPSRSNRRTRTLSGKPSTTSHFRQVGTQPRKDRTRVRTGDVLPQEEGGRGETADGRLGTPARAGRVGLDRRRRCEDGAGEGAQLERGERAAGAHVLTDPPHEVVRRVAGRVEGVRVPEHARVTVGGRPVEVDAIAGGQLPPAQ